VIQNVWNNIAIAKVYSSVGFSNSRTRNNVNRGQRLRGLKKRCFQQWVAGDVNTLGFTLALARTPFKKKQRSALQLRV
jgi:hypothetical protein